MPRYTARIALSFVVLITGLEGVTVSQVFPRAADFGLGDAPAKIKDKNGIIIRALGVTRVSP
jgi:hypothetical protein